MITVPHSWANDQTYVVTGIEMSETSTGPYTDQRTQTDTLSVDGFRDGHMRSNTHFPAADSYFDFFHSDTICKTNGWTSSGLKARLMVTAERTDYFWLPLNGDKPDLSMRKYANLKQFMWSVWLERGATVTGNPPFTYECTLSFGRAYGVSPINTTTFRFTANTAPKGEITLNPLPTTLVCPVNTDCKTQLTVLVSSTPGHISIRFGAHDNVRYLLSNGLPSDEYLGTYDTTSPVSAHPIVVSAIVRSPTAGTRIVSVPITAELT